MKLIVGLGNPGTSYAATRHNAGWWVLDHLAEVWQLGRWKKDHDAQVTDGTAGGARVRLLKPQTYMNLSGGALRPYLRRPTFKAAADLLVVVDDVALPVGRTRLRAQGSAGGHNGLKSIEGAVGSREYARLRIGVGPPADRERGDDLSDYVLSKMGKGEREVVFSLYPTVVAAIQCWVDEGIEVAMRGYNRRGEGRGEMGEGADSG